MPSPPAILCFTKKKQLFGGTAAKEATKTAKEKTISADFKTHARWNEFLYFLFPTSALRPSRRAMFLNKHLQIILCIFPFCVLNVHDVAGCVGKFMLYIICGTNTAECGTKFSLFPHKTKTFFSSQFYATGDCDATMLPFYRLPECAAGPQRITLIYMHFCLIHRHSSKCSSARKLIERENYLKLPSLGMMRSTSAIEKNDVKML